MIEIVEFDRSPAERGIVRRLILSGDGPFRVSTSCFVDTPPPPGFRPCPECSTWTVNALEPVDIEVSPKFWRRKGGEIQVRIEDATGVRRVLSLKVLPEQDATPMASAAGA